MLKTCIALVSAAFAVPAFADTHISFVDDSGQPGTQLYVKGGKVRMESGGGQGIGIYDAASNTLTLIMPEQKKYMVMNEQAADQMGATANAAAQQTQTANAQTQAAMAAHQGQMDEANQKMQAAMANMTPEQQAMMQKAMGGHGMPGGPAGATPGPMGGMQMDTKDLGTSETVAGHKCEDMQMIMNGRPMMTSCVFSGTPADLGVPAADAKTLEAMRAGMEKLRSHMGPMAQGMGSMMNKGFALKTTHQVYKNMQPVTVTDTFKGVSTGSLDASLFAIPAGYTQTTMQEMMQSHHP
ncbi:MAG: DUF4412 domain-containing protein [Bacillota bacterium]